MTLYYESVWAIVYRCIAYMRSEGERRISNLKKKKKLKKKT